MTPHMTIQFLPFQRTVSGRLVSIQTSASSTLPSETTDLPAVPLPTGAYWLRQLTSAQRQRLEVEPPQPAQPCSGQFITQCSSALAYPPPGPLTEAEAETYVLISRPISGLRQNALLQSFASLQASRLRVPTLFWLQDAKVDVSQLQTEAFQAVVRLALIDGLTTHLRATIDLAMAEDPQDPLRQQPTDQLLRDLVGTCCNHQPTPEIDRAYLRLCRLASELTAADPLHIDSLRMILELRVLRLDEPLREQEICKGQDLATWQRVTQALLHDLIACENSLQSAALLELLDAVWSLPLKPPRHLPT